MAVILLLPLAVQGGGLSLLLVGSAWNDGNCLVNTPELYSDGSENARRRVSRRMTVRPTALGGGDANAC